MNIAIMALVLFPMKIMCQPFNLAQWSDMSFDQNVDKTNGNCWGTSCKQYSPIKRNDKFLHIDEVRPISRELISAQNPWPWMCPCETRYDIANLGPGNYPRYLAVASCIPKSCHGKFNFCKLIHYKVHILKERNLDDAIELNQEQYIDQPILPEPLGIKWELKPMKIAVACIAATEGRTN